MDKKPRLDESKLTEEQREKLEKWQQDVKQLQTLEDIAAMAQEMLGIMDDQNKDPGRKTLIIDHVTGDDFVKILKNMQEAILEFRQQKAPEMPDYATPVVEAVEKLQKAVGAAAKAKDVKPVVNVDAPQVNVSPPDVDLRGIERILKKDIPDAFNSAIKKIPKVEIPETDNSELLDAWKRISEQLESIETATRMKPQFPNTLRVTNPDGTNVGTISAMATGGATPFKLVSAATTNATSVKASAGTLYNISAGNINASARYLKIYNKASSPVVGTDVPVHTFLIPGNAAGAGTNIPIGLPGIEFTIGIALALTTGVADSDTGAVAANEITVNLAYK